MEKIQLFNIKIGIEKRNFKVWIENHLHLILTYEIQTFYQINNFVAIDFQYWN